MQNEERIFAYIQLEAASILMNEKYIEGHVNVLHVMGEKLVVQVFCFFVLRGLECPTACCTVD